MKKHAVHNAITSINNPLMQSKIILIGVTSSKLLFSEQFCIRIKYCFFQQGVWGSAARFSSGVLGGAPEAKAFFGFT